MTTERKEIFYVEGFMYKIDVSGRFYIMLPNGDFYCFFMANNKKQEEQMKNILEMKGKRK